MQNMLKFNEAFILFELVGCDITRIGCSQFNSTLLLDSCHPVPTRANGRIDRIELTERVKIYDLSGKTLKCKTICKLIKITKKNLSDKNSTFDSLCSKIAVIPAQWLFF